MALTFFGNFGLDGVEEFPVLPLLGGIFGFVTKGRGSPSEEPRRERRPRRRKLESAALWNAKEGWDHRCLDPRRRRNGEDVGGLDDAGFRCGDRWLGLRFGDAAVFGPGIDVDAIQTVIDGLDLLFFYFFPQSVPQVTGLGRCPEPGFRFLPPQGPLLLLRGPALNLRRWLGLWLGPLPTAARSHSVLFYDRALTKLNSETKRSEV